MTAPDQARQLIAMFADDDDDDQEETSDGDE